MYSWLRPTVRPCFEHACRWGDIVACVGVHHVHGAALRPESVTERQLLAGGWGFPAGCRPASARFSFGFRPGGRLFIWDWAPRPDASGRQQPSDDLILKQVQ